MKKGLWFCEKKKKQRQTLHLFFLAGVICFVLDLFLETKNFWKKEFGFRFGFRLGYEHRRLSKSLWQYSTYVHTIDAAK